ncbi:ribosome biogenesis protein TSR3 isoform X1, partial [Aphis craccivora]
HLNVILDKRLTWDLHIKSKRKILNSRLHLLHSILKSKLAFDTKITVYKSLSGLMQSKSGAAQNHLKLVLSSRVPATVTSSNELYSSKYKQFRK